MRLGDRGPKTLAPGPEAIALATVLRFAGDQPALERFLDATGLDVRAQRAGMADGTLQAGLLHYLADDEDLLLGVAADLGVSPDALSAAIARRDAAGFDPADPDTPVSAGSAKRASTSIRRVRRRG